MAPAGVTRGLCLLEMGGWTGGSPPRLSPPCCTPASNTRLQTLPDPHDRGRGLSQDQAGSQPQPHSAGAPAGARCWGLPYPFPGSPFRRDWVLPHAHQQPARARSAHLPGGTGCVR